MPRSVTVTIDIELPGDLARLALPEGVDRRLQILLDKQDKGDDLTADEKAEAAGLVDLGDLISFLRLRAAQSSRRRSRR